MKNFRSLFNGFIALIFVSLMGSCVSTETVEPEEAGEKGKQIVLNITSPSDSETRADASTHKLRYIARLFRGSSLNNIDKTFEEIRREIIDGESIYGDKENQIIFDVLPDYTYTISVIADYIPIESKATDNLYEDYYYDTHSSTGRVELKPTPGTNSQTISEDFFNNDHYDLFFNSESVPKTEAKVILDMELKRVVAKVKLVDTSLQEGKHEISVKSVKYYKHYQTNGNNANGPTTIDSDINLTKNLAGAEEQELLFFYTPATKDLGTKETIKLNLQITNENSISNSFELKDIEINQNYITTVKGKFLPDTKNGDSGNNGGSENPGSGSGDGDNSGNNGNDSGNNGGDSGNGGGTGPVNGPIYLNLSIDNSEWENSSTTWH